MPLDPTHDEIGQAKSVLNAMLESIASGSTIFLPKAVNLGSASSQTALQHVGVEPNPYGGTVGHFRYQFEGEDDLLHLFVVRLDGQEFSPAQAQEVAAWLLGEFPKGLLWYKPGRLTHHFYMGHEDVRNSALYGEDTVTVLASES